MFQLASAAGIEDNLIIKTKSGSTVSYSLSTRPRVTFDGTDLVLTAPDVEVKYPVDDIEEISFDTVTSIQSVKSDNLAFTISGDVIAAQGMAKGDVITITTLDGKTLSTSASSESGEAQVDISTLNHGIYVVKAGNKSYKILK